MTDFYIDKQIQAIRDLHRDILSYDFATLSVIELLEAQSQTLVEAHRQGKDEVLFHLACWSPDHIGLPSDDIAGNPLTIEQARESMAREYGFDSWSQAKMKGNVLLDVGFESAIESLVHGRLNELQIAIRAKPQLVRQKSQFGHQATLLHYLGANGVETQRQVTPYNAVDIAQWLVDAGAEVNAVANIYGGSAVLGLVETSVHPANAGVTEALAGVLRSLGAQ